MNFQFKLFLAALSAVLLALVIAGTIVAVSLRQQTDARIEQTLIAEARVAAELLGEASGLAQGSRAEHPDLEMLDQEADRIGSLIQARVTFVAADGQVLGDSAETPQAVAAMETPH